MAQLRIFSYLPNPRVWKATITARLCDVDVEVHGAKGHELADWLWDFDARPLSEDDRANRELSRQGHTGFRTNLFKTDAFLEAHPWGTVPAAFSPDGSIGIFESNSIMRAVARIGASNYPAYGTDPYTASRIDSFLDASLVFARDCQIYLLTGWRILDSRGLPAREGCVSHLSLRNRSSVGRIERVPRRLRCHAGRCMLRR